MRQTFFGYHLKTGNYMELTPYSSFLIFLQWQNSRMEWTVAYHDEYLVELEAETEAVQDAVFALAEVLSTQGPHLDGPRCDTLNGPRFLTIKELRFT